MACTRSEIRDRVAHLLTRVGLHPSQIGRDLSRRLHEETIVIDGLNASWFFKESVLRRIRQGGITTFHGTAAAWQGL